MDRALRLIISASRIGATSVLGYVAGLLVLEQCGMCVFVVQLEGSSAVLSFVGRCKKFPERIHQHGS